MSYLDNLVAHFDMGHWDPPDIGHNENGNDGTGTNMDSTNLTEGMNGGKAIDFNGSNEHINCGNGSSLNISGDLSIAAWAKYCGGGPHEVFLSKDYTTAYEFYNSGGQLKAAINNTIFNEPSASMESGKWSFVAFAFESGSQIQIYHNDEIVKDQTTALAMGQNSLDLYLGARNNAGSPSLYMSCVLDSVFIFDAYLTRLNMMDLFQRSRNGQI